MKSRYFVTKGWYSSLLHSQQPPHLLLSQWNAEEAGSEVLVQKHGSQFFFFFKSLNDSASTQRIL
jgi:hypothetical protein